MNHRWLLLAVAVGILVDRNDAIVSIKPAGEGSLNVLRYTEHSTWVVTCSLESHTVAQTHIVWIAPDRVSVTSDSRRYLMTETIDGQPSVKLHFDPIQKSDAGKYTCAEQTQKGDWLSQQDVTIQVIDPPNVVRIQCEPVQYVRQGTVDSLRCTLQPENLKVTWQFQKGSANARRIDRNSGRFEYVSNGTLVIRGVQASDSGTYTIIGHADSGAVSQQSFRVEVVEPPRMLAPLALMGKPIEGTDLSIHCQTQGEPKPTITWFKNRQQIIISKRVGLLNEGAELHIRNLQSNDSAQYTCLASNLVDNVTSTISLRVVVRPRITRFSSQTVMLGQSLRSNLFVCEVHASEDVKLQLWKGARLLSSNEDSPRFVVERSQSSLPDELVKVDLNVIIQSVRSDDTAAYTCNASTEAGSDSKTATITVLQKPQIQSSEHWRECIKKDEAPCVLTCTVLKGSQDLQVSWWRDNVRLEDGADNGRVRVIEDNSDVRFKVSQLKLLVSVVRSTDYFRSFRCNASNYYGVDSRSFTVREVSKPLMPNVSHVYSTPTTVFYELHRPSSYSVQFPITHYTVKCTQVADRSETQQHDVVIEKYFGFRNLQVSERYLFQIAAVSEAGSSPDASPSPMPVARRAPYACEVVSPLVSDNKTSYLARWRVPNDGGGRITEYTLTYRTVESQNRQTPLGVVTVQRTRPTIAPAGNGEGVQIILVNSTRFFEAEAYEEFRLPELNDATTYELTVVAYNEHGKGDEATIRFSTYDDGTHAAVLAAATRSTVVISLFVTLILLLVIFDVMLHFYKQRGFTHRLLKNCESLDSKDTGDQYDFDTNDQHSPIMSEKGTQEHDKHMTVADEWLMRDNAARANTTDAVTDVENGEDKRTPKSKGKKDTKRSVEWLDEKSAKADDDTEKRVDTNGNVVADAQNGVAGSPVAKTNSDMVDAANNLPPPPSSTRYEALEEEDEAEQAEQEAVSRPLVAPTMQQFSTPRGSNNPNYSDASTPRSPAQQRAAVPHQHRSSRTEANGDNFPPPPAYLTQAYVPNNYLPRIDPVSGGYQLLPQPAVVVPKQRHPLPAVHQPVDVEMHRVPQPVLMQAPLNNEDGNESERELLDARPDMHINLNGARSAPVNGVAKNGVPHAHAHEHRSAERKHKHAAAAYSPAHAPMPPPPMPPQVAVVPQNVAVSEPSIAFSLPPAIGIIQEYSF